MRKEHDFTIRVLKNPNLAVLQFVVPTICQKCIHFWSFSCL